MREKSVLKLIELLINRRREMLEQVAHMESECEELRQRYIDPIDEAQKEDLARLHLKLAERGKEEIQEINQALTKMKSGSYGICELCGKSIPFKRLRVLPEARLCRNCAQKYEEARKLRKHHRDEIIDDEQLNEYRNIAADNESKRHITSGKAP